MNTLYEKVVAVITGAILLGICGELFDWILELTHLLTETMLTNPATHYNVMQVLAVNSVGYFKLKELDKEFLSIKSDVPESEVEEEEDEFKQEVEELLSNYPKLQ